MDDPGTILIMIIIGVVVSAGIGHIIGASRGRNDGWAWGLFLGPFGWIISALLPRDGRKCPECLGVVPDGARKCLHCGESLGLSAQTMQKRTEEIEKMENDRVNVDCPACGMSLSVLSEKAKNELICPVCKARFTTGFSVPGR